MQSRRYFNGMSSDVPAFEVPVFASDFEFWIEVNAISSQILVTILLSIDHYSGVNWTFT